LKHADDGEPHVVDLEVAPQRGAVPEQVAAHAGPDYADLGVGPFVEGVQETPLGQAHS
jgi:hypothetical protein